MEPKQEHSEEELKKMSIFQLNRIVRERNIQMQGRRDKQNLIKHILDEQSGSHGSFTQEFFKRFSKSGPKHELASVKADKGDAESLNLRSRKQEELEREMASMDKFMAGHFKGPGGPRALPPASEEKKKGISGFLEGLDHLGVKKEKEAEITQTRRRKRLSESSLSLKEHKPTKEELEAELTDEMGKMEALLNKILPEKEEPKEIEVRPKFPDRPKRSRKPLKPRDPMDGKKVDEGLTNGHGMSIGAGITNGHGISNVSGLTNGHGITNGSGISLGAGFTNGLSKGMGFINGNGLTNGNGLVNGTGLTNGNGLTQGSSLLRYFYLRKEKGQFQTSAVRRQVRISMIQSRVRRETVMASLIVLTLLMIPIFIYFTGLQESSFISIDGKFDDWDGVPLYIDTFDPGLDPNIDIQHCSITDRGSDLSVHIKVRGNAIEGSFIENRTRSTGNAEIPYRVYGEDTINIYLDSDGNSSTGYSYGMIGAESMIEIAGSQGEPTTSKAFKFKGGNQNDHQGFEYFMPVQVAVKGSDLEAQLWHSEEVLKGGKTLEARIEMRNYDQDFDISDDIIGLEKGSVIIREEIIAPELIEVSGLPYKTVFSIIEIEPKNKDSKISEIGLRINGDCPIEDINDIMLIRDVDKNGIINDLDVALPTTFTGNSVVFNEPISIKNGNINKFLLIVTFKNTASGSSIGIRIDHSTSVTEPRMTLDSSIMPGVDLVSTYLGRIPDSIVIDGAFGDWNNIEKVKDNLDRDASASSRSKNNDLKEWRVDRENSKLFINVEVFGDMLGGTTVPLSPYFQNIDLWQGNDLDGDGVYDQVDPNPNDPRDTDLDSLPDDYEVVMMGTDPNEADSDGDGITDDKDFAPLDPSIWEYVPPSNGDLEELIGEDGIYIFQNLEDPDVGYQPGWLPFKADYVQIIKGKYGTVLSSQLLSFKGNDEDVFNFTLVNDVPLAIDQHRLETMIDLSSINAGNELGLFVVSVNWDNSTRDTFEYGIDQNGSILESDHRSIELFNDAFNGPAVPGDYSDPLEISQMMKMGQTNTDTFQNLIENSFKWVVEFKTIGSGRLSISGDLENDVLVHKLDLFNEKAREFEEVEGAYVNGRIVYDWGYRMGKFELIPISNNISIEMEFGNIVQAHYQSDETGKQLRSNMNYPGSEDENTIKNQTLSSNDIEKIKLDLMDFKTLEGTTTPENVSSLGNTEDIASSEGNGKIDSPTIIRTRAPTGGWPPAWSLVVTDPVDQLPTLPYLDITEIYANNSATYLYLRMDLVSLTGVGLGSEWQIYFQTDYTSNNWTVIGLFASWNTTRGFVIYMFNTTDNTTWTLQDGGFLGGYWRSADIDDDGDGVFDDWGYSFGGVAGLANSICFYIKLDKLGGGNLLSPGSGMPMYGRTSSTNSGGTTTPRDRAPNTGVGVYAVVPELEMLAIPALTVIFMIFYGRRKLKRGGKHKRHGKENSC